MASVRVRQVANRARGCRPDAAPQPQRALAIPGFPDSPTHLSVCVAARDYPNVTLVAPPLPLYAANGVPRWIECGPGPVQWPRRVDLAALPIELPEELLLTRIEEVADDQSLLYAGREVVIIGYPFGVRPEHPLPTWKRGAVASEPSVPIDGMPKYFIDTPGRPGMSGSPVFTISPGIGVSEVTMALFNDYNKGDVDALTTLMAAFPSHDAFRDMPEGNALQFAGIYAGSLGDADLSRLNLGIGWHAGMVDQLFEHSQPGTNPFPPHSLGSEGSRES